MNTRNLSRSNTDGVRSTDRTATGPQPDDTPVGPGGNGVTQIVAGSGIAVSPPGGTGVVTVSATGGSGTVTSITTTGRGATSTPNPIVGAGTLNNFDPDHFNVCDYGADRTGVADSYAAIVAAIAAGVALNAPFCLYFPCGTYKSSHATPITLTSSAASVDVRGDSAKIVYTDTGADAGMTITKGLSGGSYDTDSVINVDGITFVSSANQAAIALTLAGPATTGSGTAVLNRVTRCAFDSSANDTAHYWAAAISLSDCNNVAISQCKFLRQNIGILITGTSGATSVFMVTDNDFQGGTYGIQANGLGSVVNRIEGVTCQNNSFVLQNYAVWMENTNTGGVLSVVGGQIVPTAGAGAGVHAKNVRAVMVHAVNIGNDGTGAWTGVELYGDCLGSTVTGCYFAGSNAGGTVRGVYVENAANVTVGLNAFTGFTGSNPVLFDTGVTLSNCSNNTSDGGTYSNLGTGDNFNNNI